MSPLALCLSLLAATGGSPANALGAPSPAALCQADKLAAAGKFVDCRLKAEAAFARTSDAGKRATSIDRCGLKLSASFAKADGKYGTSCPNVATPGDFESYLTQCAERTTSASGGGDFGPGASASCGNGAVDAESCDGADLGGQSCGSLGLGSGTLACDATCGFDTSACVAPTCGDGVVNAPGEECDGGDLGGASCASAGYVSGSITCAADCSLDVSDCAVTRCCQIPASTYGTAPACTDIEPDIAATTCGSVASFIPGAALAAAGAACSGATGFCGPPPPASPGTCCQLEITGLGHTCAENGSATDCARLDSILTNPFCGVLGVCGTAVAHPGEVCRPLTGTNAYTCVAP